MRRYLLLPLLISISIAYLQAQTIIGEIRDSETRNTLEDVNISCKGAKFFESSDLKGKYIIHIENECNTLIYSLVGYDRFEMPLKNSLRDTIILNVELLPREFFNEEVIVYAKRVYPFAMTNLKKSDIRPLNLGQDIPFLVAFTPSVVASSDAGAGIGYTDMRIRGIDPTGISVSINGIPFNDPESHSVFWVDIPDIASSVDNIQIQRGVGSSVNGTGAFGGSINLITSASRDESVISIGATLGSFNTSKYNFGFNLGSIANKFSLSGRLSSIYSDGYIDRSRSDLNSWFLAANYAINDKHSISINSFSGDEITQQAWYGTPEAKINNDIEGMNLYATRNFKTSEQKDNLLLSGRTYNHYIYENEIDKYKQSHGQLLYYYNANSKWNFRTTLHYTKGRGYFEQYNYDKNFSFRVFKSSDFNKVTL